MYKSNIRESNSEINHPCVSCNNCFDVIYRGNTLPGAGFLLACLKTE